MNETVTAPFQGLMQQCPKKHGQTRDYQQNYGNSWSKHWNNFAFYFYTILVDRLVMSIKFAMVLTVFQSQILARCPTKIDFTKQLSAVEFLFFNL